MIIPYRLLNQHISHHKLKKPQDIVSYLGAMQAQEYAMAKWAIGLRLPGTKDADVEKAFNKGHILRTHLLRPTWHFVSPADIRWMLALTKDRVYAVSAFMFRKSELTDKIFNRSADIFTKMLQGGNHLERNVLKAALEKAKIPTDEFLLSYMLMHAEMEGVICSGPRVGKQFTYALLEERVPPVKSISREEALNELTHRYFKSRGPATVQDFAVWSGLTAKDARNGIASLDKKFIHEKINDREFIFYKRDYSMATSDSTFLMPDYDEYGMSYRGRSDIFNKEKFAKQISRGNPIFNRMIIINGKIEGTWNRTVTKKALTINSFPFSSLSKENQRNLLEAEKKYRLFLGDNLEA
ncbi:MAG: winged helix DNA-binding domain-containing protein [Cyclobacteriaceae bacterium]|nr:winged helix DNA-binding domain-containing protein [Cyclobacteriaceae bacterium]